MVCLERLFFTIGTARVESSPDPNEMRRCHAQNLRTVAPPARAREPAPRLHDLRNAMSNVLIVYATREGQTEKIAKRIAATVIAEGHAAELFDLEHSKERRTPEQFDVVVIGASLHGGYPRSIVRFAREHRTFLNGARSAFFSVGLAVASRTSDGRAQTLRLVEKLTESTGWRPRRVELFAGALLYTKYNFLLRYIMRQITKKEGGDTDTSRDYEYTDWVAVDRFARDLVRGDAAGATVDRTLVRYTEGTNLAP
jgi:menaquinone-dependent protoporphyrinogen oxidase